MIKKTIEILILFAVFSGVFYSQSPKGYLVIIGGGDRSDNIMNKIIELAGGSEAEITIIPMASSEPLETAIYQKNEFEELGAHNVNYIFCSREDADSDSIVSKLKNTTGVFFSGGDQSRLTDCLLNTKLLEAISAIYQNGGVLSGTSAGAAVMSRLMITGNEFLNKDSVYGFMEIRKNNIEIKKGFGFVTEGVIDQHFIYRKRHNRLISVILENPDLVGIGIDESTSIVVYPDRTFEVLGMHQVIIYDAGNAADIKADANGFLSAQNIVMHILSEGEKYDLITRSIVQ